MIRCAVKRAHTWSIDAMLRTNPTVAVAKLNAQNSLE
jgi:hypothetical protein